jgi:hypothetical protein
MESEAEETTVLGEVGLGVKTPLRHHRASFWSQLPRPELVFICQMVIIYVVIGVSLFNLTSGSRDTQDGKLWIALLSSCLGYLLPNPKLEVLK